MFVGNLEAVQKNLWLRKAWSNPSKLQIDVLHVLSSPWRTKTTNFLNKNFWTTKTKENAPPSSQGSHGNYQPKQCNSLLFSGKFPRKFAIDSCIKFHSPSQKKRGSQFKFFPCRLTGHPPLISILSKSSASRAPLAMRIRIRRCPRPFFSVEMTGRSFGSWLTPLKINILHIVPCRFGFKSFSFLFMGDGCRFQPLIFQGLSQLFADLFKVFLSKKV